jgi:acyl-CoA hydrolase
MDTIQTVRTQSVFPKHLNDNGTLFGGQALMWMDQVAHIAASRATGIKMVTVRVEQVKFLQAVAQGEVVDVIGTVIEKGNIKVKVHVEIVAEKIETGQRIKAIEGCFVFAAVDDQNRPIRLDLKVNGER